MSEPEGFREFIVARSPALLRSAELITGDLQLAQDLVQTGLANAWPVIAAVVVPLTVPGHAGPPAVVSVAAPGTVRLGIVSFDLPAGWTAGQTPCDLVPAKAVNQCPQARGPAGATVKLYPTSVLSNYFMSYIAFGPCRTIAATITVAGIPGEVSRGCGNPPGGVLAFDLVNVAVRITGTDQAQAGALERSVHLHPATSLEVPATAPFVNVGVQTSSSLPVGQSPGITVTGTNEVALLTALQHAPLLPATTTTCYPAKTAVVAVPQGRTYAISGGSCNEIVTGNGTIARTTPELKAALAAILGSNSLD